MSCDIGNNVSIKEIADENSVLGPVLPAVGLTEDQTKAILSNIAKQRNQTQFQISDGLGTYGLTMDNLKAAGIVKNCITVSTALLDLATILQDASVFTGKYGVKNVDNLLENQGLQRQILSIAILSVTTALLRQGTLKTTDSTSTKSSFAGLASRFSTTEISNYKKGTITGTQKTEMDALSSTSQYAVSLNDNKKSDLQNKVKGIGGGSVTVPKSSKGTVKTADVDAEVDKLIGSKRIPSTVNPDELLNTSTNLLSEGDYF